MLPTSVKLYSNDSVFLDIKLYMFLLTTIKYKYQQLLVKLFFTP